MNPSYLYHLRVGERGQSVLFAPSHSLLAGRVFHVVVMGSKEQMPNTARVIPVGAVVANFKTVGDRAVKERPRDTVNEGVPSGSTTKPDVAISVGVFRAGPYPATVRPDSAIHTAPKSIGKRLAFGNAGAFRRAEFSAPLGNETGRKKEEVAALLTGERKACKVTRHSNLTRSGDTSRGRYNVRRLNNYSTKSGLNLWQS